MYMYMYMYICRRNEKEKQSSIEECAVNKFNQGQHSISLKPHIPGIRCRINCPHHPDRTNWYHSPQYWPVPITHMSRSVIYSSM